MAENTWLEYFASFDAEVQVDLDEAQAIAADLGSLPELTPSEVRWLEIEECLDSIALDIQNRCYPEHNISGVSRLTSVVIHSLNRIVELLLTELLKDA